MSRRKYQRPTGFAVEGNVAWVGGEDCERPIAVRRTRDKWRLIGAVFMSMGRRERELVAANFAAHAPASRLREILNVHEKVRELTA